jgi:ubiquinone/menaquinone biosynthesis C-methylase UbiE
MAEQSRIDRENAAFWDELCGTGLARSLGITDASSESLARYDEAYLAQYPYLEDYLPGKEARGQRVLEIGLGFGTVSQLLAARGLDYHGLDIAENPVEMTRHRLALEGVDDPESRVRVGSALEIPHPDESFDQLVTIGCLHHTGDIPGGVAEIHRVLRPSGRALVMLYNRYSYRRLRAVLSRRLRGEGPDDQELRARYDRNAAGIATPATDYTSVREAKRHFREFAQVRVRRENFDLMMRHGNAVDRDLLLGWPARLAGLDLYITAVK